MVLVLLYHLGVPWVQNAWLEIGYFFTVSAVLITHSSMHAAEKGKFRVCVFWSRRVVRLFPPLLVLLWVVCGHTWLHKEGLLPSLSPDSLSDDFLSRRRADLLCALGYCTNILLIRRNSDYFSSFDPPSPLRHLWSLSVEEQYYLIWPILLVLWTSVVCPLAESTPYPGKEEEVEGEGRGEKEVRRRREERVEGSLSALRAGEAVLVVCSVLIARWTLAHMGPSAAYYSSWTRVQVPFWV